MSIIQSQAKFLAIRLSRADRAWLEKEAEQRGISLTEMVRACIVSQRDGTTLVELLQSIRDDITNHISDGDHQVIAALADRMEPIARSTAEMLAILIGAKVN